MTEAELKIRMAEIEWQAAKEKWMDDQRLIREAKALWEQAQREFFTGAMPTFAEPASTCGDCTGCCT